MKERKFTDQSVNVAAEARLERVHVRRVQRDGRLHATLPADEHHLAIVVHGDELRPGRRAPPEVGHLVRREPRRPGHDDEPVQVHRPRQAHPVPQRERLLRRHRGRGAREAVVVVLREQVPRQAAGDARPEVAVARRRVEARAAVGEEEERDLVARGGDDVRVLGSDGGDSQERHDGDEARRRRCGGRGR
jgi:hypothetical protein